MIMNACTGGMMTHDTCSAICLPFSPCFHIQISTITAARDVVRIAIEADALNLQFASEEGLVLVECWAGCKDLCSLGQ